MIIRRSHTLHFECMETPYQEALSNMDQAFEEVLALISHKNLKELHGTGHKFWAPGGIIRPTDIIIHFFYLNLNEPGRLFAEGNC